MYEIKNCSHKIQKLGFLIRSLCCFLFACSMLAFVGAVVAMVLEPFHFITIVGVLVSLIMGHVSGKILLTGYAPKYLLFAHGRLRVDKL